MARSFPKCMFFENLNTVENLRGRSGRANWWKYLLESGLVFCFFFLFGKTVTQVFAIQMQNFLMVA